MKYDRPSFFARQVRRFSELIVGTREPPQVAVALSLSQRLEQQEISSRFRVVSYCEVAANELHISVLAFSCIQKHPFLIPPVGITKLLTTFTREQKIYRMVLGRRDAALLLATV